MKDVKTYNKILPKDYYIYEGVNTPENMNTNKRTVEVLFYPDGKLIIIGKIKNVYVYWYSVTSVKNKKVNERIFNHISNKDYDFSNGFTSDWHIRNKNRIIDQGHSEYFYVDLEKMWVDAHNYEGKIGYGSDSVSNWGKFFIWSIEGLFRRIKAQCEFRELGGKYASILKGYKKSIKEHGYWYAKDKKYGKVLHLDKDIDVILDSLEPLRIIVENESYLLCSDKEEIRIAYIELKEALHDVYNTYMDLRH